LKNHVKVFKILAGTRITFDTHVNAFKMRAQGSEFSNKIL